MKAHPEEISDDFTKNKLLVQKYTDVKSHKIRNVIAGYVSRLSKQSKERREKRRTSSEDISKFY